MKTSPAPVLVALCAALAVAGLACSQSQDHGPLVSGCGTPTCAQGIGGGGYAPVFSQDGSVDGESGVPGDSGAPGTDTGGLGSDTGGPGADTGGLDGGADSTSADTGGSGDAPAGG